jgi:paired small multidrug resistance pump
VSIAWYDLVGTAGVALILLAYYLLQVGRIDIQGLLYSAANLLGAALITVSLMFAFNFSSFLIELCWMAISLVGIARYFRKRRR